MEKLLNLLRQYAPDYCKDYPDNIIMDEIVISKRFGFIKRLIDNDKIDKVKQVIKDIDIWGSDTITGVDTYSDYESLLMLLAISNEPINDLISYLK